MLECYFLAYLHFGIKATIYCPACVNSSPQLEGVRGLNEYDCPRLEKLIKK